MPTLPHSLYRAAQVRELDRIAIEEHGILGATLMARAGASAFSALRAQWPQVRRIVVVCGLGNNAGDGFVLTRLACEAGFEVKALQVGDRKRLRGDALGAHKAMLEAGGATQAFSREPLEDAEIIVDALFGTGLDREVIEEWREAIEAMNQSTVPVLAIDIPSGLHADSGRVWGIAVRAALTISFIGLKQGMFTAEGPDHCGRVLLDALEVPPPIINKIQPSARRLTLDSLPKLAPRARNAHKGKYGHVLVIGGDYGMAGAARLAAEGAARVGAGLISLATRAAHAASASAQRPELLCHGVEHVKDLHHLLQAASVVAIGPGLGRGEWGAQLLSAVLESSLSLVVDADALNLLAIEPTARGNWVLTPHPGEAARLLGWPTAQVQADRFSAIEKLQRRYQGVIVLKGTGSLVLSEAGPVAVCAAGNPGMASGGMGDLLTGVIAGLIAQGLALGDAARLGVCLHAEAGDRAAVEGERGMLASDLLPHLRRLVNPP